MAACTVAHRARSAMIVILEFIVVFVVSKMYALDATSCAKTSFILSKSSSDLEASSHA